MRPEAVARTPARAPRGGDGRARRSASGYADTTLRELVALAGVSKSTFYEHFESKQDCFLATFDDIVDEIVAGSTRRSTAPAPCASSLTRDWRR